MVHKKKHIDEDEEFIVHENGNRIEVSKKKKQRPNQKDKKKKKNNS